MNILVVGAGMYVTGRSGGANGTILSSLAEASKTLPVGRVVVAAQKEDNAEIVRNVIDRINTQLGTNLVVEYVPIKMSIRESIESLVRQYEIDSAIVSVPDELHFSYCKELLLCRVHTLVVKPFTPTVKEALELIQIQESSGIWGAVEFHKRYDETNQYAKKVYQQGQLGRLLYATVDYSQRVIIPTKIFREWCETTNPFQYLGTHYVDLLYYLTGYTPISLMAIGTEGRLREESINAYDSVHASVIWTDPEHTRHQFVSNFNINWIDPNTTSAMSDQRYKLVGTKGRIELDQRNRGLEVVNEENGIRIPNPYFSEYLEGSTGNDRFSGYGHESIFQFMKDVLDVREGRISVDFLANHRPGFRQSLVSVAVVEAATRSLANNHEWVEIEGNIFGKA